MYNNKPHARGKLYSIPDKWTDHAFIMSCSKVRLLQSPQLLRCTFEIWTVDKQQNLSQKQYLARACVCLAAWNSKSMHSMPLKGKKNYRNIHTHTIVQIVYERENFLPKINLYTIPLIVAKFML